MSSVLTKLMGIRDFYPEGSEVDQVVEQAIAELQTGEITDDLRGKAQTLRADLGDCTVVRLLTMAGL